MLLQPLSPSSEIAAAIDQHVASFRQQEAERQANSPESLARTAPPPTGAAVSAGLAHIADSILNGTPDEARQQIRPLLPSSAAKAGRSNWARWVTVSAIPCSEGLQAAYDPLLRRFTSPFSLARELSDPDMPLVNYQQRRALQNWSIDERTWDSLVARMPPISRTHMPDLGDRKRQLASVYVWVRVTAGEPTSAPRPLEAAQPPDVREGWRRSWNRIR